MSILSSKYNLIVILSAVYFVAFSGVALSQEKPEGVEEDTVDVIVADTIKASVFKTTLIQADSLTTKTIIQEDKVDAKEDETKILKIDFETRQVESLPNGINKGDIYNLVIENINMNLYDISYNNNDTTISSDVTFPTFEMAGLESLTELVSGLRPISDVTETIENMMDNTKSDTTTIEEMMTASKTVRNSLAGFRWYLIKKERKLSKINRSIDKLSLLVQTFADHYLVENSDDLRKELKGQSSAIKVLGESRRYRKKLIAFIKEIEEKQKEYNDFYERNKKIIEKNDLKESHQKISKIISAILSGADEVYTSINAETVSGWINSIIHLDNNSDRTYRSLPLQLNGDYTDLSITIKPKKEEFGLPSYHTTIRFPVSKWYVGAGMGFYYGWNFRDEAYSISAETIDSTTVEYEIVDEDTPKGEGGIATLLHVGRNLGSDWFSLNLAIGPALSLSKTPKPRLAIGAGMTLGANRKQKFFINWLYMGGQVSRLSKAYENSMSGTVAPEDVPDNVTISKFDWRGGISVGYIFNF